MFIICFTNGGRESCGFIQSHPDSLSRYVLANETDTGCKAIFAGYANEVGEAFRSIIGSKWVAGSYAVATGYVIADTVDKTRRTHLVNKNGGRAALPTVLVVL